MLHSDDIDKVLQKFNFFKTEIKNMTNDNML